VKRIAAVVIGVVVALFVFAIGTGAVAALLAAIAHRGWVSSRSMSIALGGLLELLKWGVGIWSGYRSYKHLSRKPVTATAMKS
jgi:hypothetical protein